MKLQDVKPGQVFSFECDLKRGLKERFLMTYDNQFVGTYGRFHKKEDFSSLDVQVYLLVKEVFYQ